MTPLLTKRTASLWAVTIIAVLFGLVTIKSGGSVLFIDGEARQNAGNYVPFVLWFNFTAGFAYLIAGAGLWKQQRWAAWLAMLIAVATLVVFTLLALHILNGGHYELRTVIAMSLRSLVWILIGVFASKTILRQGH